MKKHLKSYRLFLTILAINLLLAAWKPPVAGLSVTKSMSFLVEVLLIVPPVILMGLLDAWVPRQLVEAHLGLDAGVRGSVVAILLGTAAAGPLYAAFPIALSLQKKGARLANVVIFLGTWATIKIPMIVMEGSFLGLRFALLRLTFTIPCVLAVGYLMEVMIPVENVPEVLASTEQS